MMHSSMYSQKNPHAKPRLDSLEAIPSTETDGFFQLIKRLFQLDAMQGLTQDQKRERKEELPEEENELMKLLDEEEITMTSDQDMNPLDRYQKISGNEICWVVSNRERSLDTEQLLDWFSLL